MIHLYCGDGKGKTTAAMGLIARALGRDRKVVLVQFLKGSKTGEIMFFSKCDNLEILRSKKVMKFSFQMTDEEKDNARNGHNAMLKEALLLEYDMLVLDEAMGAIGSGLLDSQILKDAIINFSEEKELVMTGRDPEKFFVEHADYVSEIKCIKHPYKEGVLAREGVEF